MFISLCHRFKRKRKFVVCPFVEQYIRNLSVCKQTKQTKQTKRT
jgi:hypothetical protein